MRNFFPSVYFHPGKYTKRLPGSRRKIFEFQNHFGHMTHERNLIQFYISPYQVPTLRGFWTDGLRRARTYLLTYGPGTVFAIIFSSIFLEICWWETHSIFDKDIDKYEKKYQARLAENKAQWISLTSLCLVLLYEFPILKILQNRLNSICR